MLYKIVVQKWAKLHRKNDLLKATMSQRHSNYYGFVKTGFEKRQLYYPRNNMIYVEKLNFLCHFGAHWILKVVPKSTSFENIEKNEKKEVQEAALKNMVCWSIFDAKMRSLKSEKRGFRIMTVVNHEI